MKIGIVKDKRYMNHKPPMHHPESPSRLEVIYGLIDGWSELLDNSMLIEPEYADIELVETVHDRSYIERIKEACKGSYSMLDPDTYTSSESFGIALLAVGGAKNAIDAIMRREVGPSFAFIRPPGHHAERSKAMGFCLFNNIAIAAKYIISEYNLSPILIVDWDLHHGNGTQHAFYSSNKVLYFSTHQFPYYPGTGDYDEIGEGEGVGYTVNVPMPGGQGDAEYLEVYEKILKPIAKELKPKFVLVSAGFDPHMDDPLGSMRLSGKGFGKLTSSLIDVANESADGRILFLLEGGYSPSGLKDGVSNVLKAMMGQNVGKIDKEPSSSINLIIEKVKDVQKEVWRSLL